MRVPHMHVEERDAARSGCNECRAQPVLHSSQYGGLRPRSPRRRFAPSSHFAVKSPSAAEAAATVWSISPSVWAAPKKAASNWEGGQ